MEFDLIKVVELNSPTPFSVVNSDYIFEDSVTCKYSSSFVKLKMYECLYRISHLIEKLDFTTNSKELLKTQG